MKNLVYKFLLSVCILLLSGYGEVYALGTSAVTSKRVESKSLQSSIDQSQSDQTYISTPFSSRHERDLKVEVTDISEEENHIVPPVQFLETFDYFSAFFYALLFGYLFQNPKGTFRIGEYTPYFSSFSPLYLAFRVIRL